MAMRVQLVPLEGKKEILLDKAEMYIVLQGEVSVKPVSPFIGIQQVKAEEEHSNEDQSQTFSPREAGDMSPASIESPLPP